MYIKIAEKMTPIFERIPKKRERWIKRVYKTNNSYDYIKTVNHKSIVNCFVNDKTEFKYAEWWFVVWKYLLGLEIKSWLPILISAIIMIISVSTFMLSRKSFEEQEINYKESLSKLNIRIDSLSFSVHRLNDSLHVSYKK